MVQTSTTLSGVAIGGSLARATRLKGGILMELLLVILPVIATNNLYLRIYLIFFFLTDFCRLPFY